MLWHTDQDIIKDIRDAWRAGRVIVPLIGAGFSAEVGVPTIQGVVRYLAQLRGYVRDGAYMPTAPGITKEVTDASPALKVLLDKRARYAKELPLFVQEHGWGDSFQLAQDYARWLLEHNPPGTLGEESARQLDELAELLYPDQVAQMRGVLPYDAGPPPNPLAPKESVSVVWQLLGRWPDLVHQTTGGNAGYARSLFERLRRGARPGLSHRFLAFLTPLLGIPLVLSTAFDDLLEQALRAADVEHTVFPFEGGRRFPSAALVRATTAVVKLDGDLGDMIGGPMYLPLERPCLDEFERCLPRDALLLVMGSGGHDRRVLDLVSHVLRRRTSKEGPPLSGCITRRPCRARSRNSLSGATRDATALLEWPTLGYSSVTSTRP